MLQVLGKSTSINVRKVLWLCDEIGLPYEQQQWGSGHRDTRLPEFTALNPNALVPVIRDGEFVLGDQFTLADIVLGLATNRWFMTPMERPPLAAVSAYYERLSQRPAYLRHGRNGVP